jgi:cobalt-zinc-cadmium efflux system protein
VLAGLILYEGIRRLISPPPAGGTAMLIVALVALVVNLAATWQHRYNTRRAPTQLAV